MVLFTLVLFSKFIKKKLRFRIYKYIVLLLSPTPLSPLVLFSGIVESVEEEASSHWEGWPVPARQRGEMDPSGLGLGGLKAGAPTDPLAFIKRPSVVIRICSLVGLVRVWVPDFVYEECSRVLPGSQVTTGCMTCNVICKSTYLTNWGTDVVMWLSCGLWFDIGDIVALCKVENHVIRICTLCVLVPMVSCGCHVVCGLT